MKVLNSLFRTLAENTAGGRNSWWLPVTVTSEGPRRPHRGVGV